MVRTKTLVKGAVIQVEAAPFRSWYEQHYGVALGKKKAAAAGKEEAPKKKSRAVKITDCPLFIILNIYHEQ
jgi:small subunit ribosomal protein S8e